MCFRKFYYRKNVFFSCVYITWRFLCVYSYFYRSDYGRRVVYKTAPKITGAEVTAPKTVRVTVDSLIHGHVHELNAKGIRSAKGLPILHPVGYYTLNEIPPGEIN